MKSFRPDGAERRLAEKKANWLVLQRPGGEAHLIARKKLPRLRSLVVDRSKVVQYLLNREHPDGRHKARFFERFGFNVEKWTALAEALRSHGRTHPVASVVESSYGTRYIVEGDIVTPDGRNPRIRTVWLVEAQTTRPRLITAYPV